MGYFTIFHLFFVLVPAVVAAVAVNRLPQLIRPWDFPAGVLTLIVMVELFALGYLLLLRVLGSRNNWGCSAILVLWGALIIVGLFAPGAIWKGVQPGQIVAWTAATAAVLAGLIWLLGPPKFSHEREPR